MSKKNLLLLSGGGSDEHEVSLVSAQFIKEHINLDKFNIIDVVVDDKNYWNLDGEFVHFQHDNFLLTKSGEIEIHVALPCFHGFPGETGHIQALFEMKQIPYIGCSHEVSMMCFNKVTTKTWMDQFNIPNTEYVFVYDLSEESLNKAKTFFDKYKKVYVKAASQGSSVGCYPVDEEENLKDAIESALQYSTYVLIERHVHGREFEVAAFEYQGKLHITDPGEIHCPADFYSYEEKYDKNSQTTTSVVAENVDSKIIKKIKKLAQRMFTDLQLRHLTRIDFFLEGENIYINEPNTFPGHTNISLFPLMMKNYGVNYSDFINYHLAELTQ